MTSNKFPSVIVNDNSCLVALRKGRLLHLLVNLPYQVVIPLLVWEDEMIKFTEQETKILDSEATIHDLPFEQMQEVYDLKSIYKRPSVADCSCLVTALHYEDVILLTGDKQLRNAAKDSGCCVHGALWVIDEIERLELCKNAILIKALESW